MERSYENASETPTRTLTRSLDNRSLKRRSDIGKYWYTMGDYSFSGTHVCISPFLTTFLPLVSFLDSAV